MSPEKEAILLEKFPHLYRGYSKSMKETCMCWGFDCEDGWFELIYSLSSKIDSYLNLNNKTEPFLYLKRILRRFLYKNNIPTIALNLLPYFVFNFLTKLSYTLYDAFEVVQVKEKFGTLRYYVNLHDDIIGTFIVVAENESAYTCESCGEYDRSGLRVKIRGKHWVSTKCDKCYAKEREKCRSK